MTIIDYWALPYEEREALKGKARLVNCGPDCECDTPKTGISIGRLDSRGDIYPDAVGVTLDKYTNEWVVVEQHGDFRPHEEARYPVAEVETIRYLPNETRLYTHWVLDEEEA